ncbi:hypothetical protein M0R45_014710 [Rubus argutus]|uniref:RING-type E3 ubiquitin transferase n=1 Tax=Rubus argutus TaxID=59490 RepID=A0AAW1XNR6_RUBAR
MGQRNMICPSQMMDLEMYQQASGSSTNFDAQHLPERYDNVPFYGMTQYNGQHPHNLDLGVATPANFYYSYMTPSSSSGVLPVPMNHGASDSVPSSSNYGVVGISAADEYGRNSRIMDDLRGPCKRKNPECLPGNFQYFNASGSPSSSVPPLNMRHPEGVAVMDAVNFSLPQYGGTGNPPIMEAGPQISMRNRSATTGLESVPTHDHNHNHLSQGNYVGQRFQPAGTIWLDQHLNSNSGDGGPSAWNQVPIPFMHGGNVGGGSMDSVNMGMQRYHDSSSNRSSSILRHPPPLNHRHQNHHVVPPPMQGLRGHNLNLPHIATEPSYRLPTSSSRSTTRNPSQNGLEIGRRQPGPIPQTGFRIYRPHQGVISETALRHHNFSHWRVLGVDEGVILDVPEFGNFSDQHRDMRLDIEDMSYEELLALGEQIGHVNTGLSEDSISKQLKTRSYLSSGTIINLEEAGCPEKEVDFCIICQDFYKNQEKIGTLHCGHEYHADCLKKWLLVKNVCPICKSEALITGKKNV